MKKEKGQYGYRNSRRRMRLMITVVLVAAILAQLAGRYLTDDQAAKNILTVMAILTVLPMANMASPLLASWKYRTPPAEFYEKMKPYEEKCTILYDLILTTKEYVLPMDAIAVHSHGIYAFCTAGRLDVGKAEKSLNMQFAAGGSGRKIRIIPDEKSFFRRLDSLKPEENQEKENSAEYELSLLKSMSM